MDNTCVCCDAIIPEGRMVCPNCENAFIDNVEFRRDWNLPIADKELQEYEKVIKVVSRDERSVYYSGLCIRKQTNK